MIYRYYLLLFKLLTLVLLTACDYEPPTLMKANTPFATVQERDQHIAYMRTHHMHALKHKRDATVYQGIRTQEHSLKACINCHVPESYEGKVLRHTDPEHFCTTCHTYVAEKLNCFECHVDHPVKHIEALESDSTDLTIDVNAGSISSHSTIPSVKNISHLNQQELIDLAFKYANPKDEKSKVAKRWGVGFKDNTSTKLKANSADKGGNSE